MRWGRWLLCGTEPGQAADPSALSNLETEWIDATVPGTVAEALALASRPLPADLDALDWWYCGSFTLASDAPIRFRFRGLATLAEVWIDGALVLATRNMFRSWSIDMSSPSTGEHEIAICFRSLSAAMALRRPRPRWKTRLVNHQNLRWFRTTLLGRIPGWTPAVPAIGPWRPIEAFPAGTRDPIRCALTARLSGDSGFLEAALEFAEHEAVSGWSIRCGGASAALTRCADGSWYGSISIGSVERWWPHTHGRPLLYPVELLRDGDPSTALEIGRVGFREVECDSGNAGFGIKINGEPIFCRGVCWMPLDMATLRAPSAQFRLMLTMLRDAGANMIRISGTTIYEDEELYSVCDELGILVWQDFMFANMDYPIDEQFLREVRAEADELISRLSGHPSVIVWCGNSEVEQQAAMQGVPRELWRNAIFGEVLPKLTGTSDGAHIWVASTPSGGAMPFHTSEGVTHYYGVGAYLRDFSDVRRADVKFTPECLGFSNVPDLALLDSEAARGSEQWKRGIPRDSGTDWDFEDVRDHYTGVLFEVDPKRLRETEPERYLRLSSLSTGEAMSRAFSEWRSTHSRCNGGLVWFSKDLSKGPGWGITDVSGRRKPCFHQLARVWQPQTIVWTDEGLNGLHLHLINESSEALDAEVKLELIRDGHVVVARGVTRNQLPPRSKLTIGSDAILGGFFDITWAYRFGPPAYEVAIATLRRMPDELELAETYFFPRPGVPPSMDAHPGAFLEREEAGSWIVTVTSDDFLHSARVVCHGYELSDNDFHLAPGRVKRIKMTAVGNAPPSGYLEALNLREPVALQVRS